MSTRPHIGVLPLARATFDVAYAEEMAGKAFAALEGMGVDVVRARGLPTSLGAMSDKVPSQARGLLFDEEAVERAIGGLRGEAVDVLLVMQVTFTDAAAVVRVAEAWNNRPFDRLRAGKASVSAEATTDKAADKEEEEPHAKAPFDKLRTGQSREGREPPFDAAQGRHGTQREEGERGEEDGASPKAAPSQARDDTQVRPLREEGAEEADKGVPLVLWGFPEPRTGGRLRLNSLCGINLAAHALGKAGYAYRWLYCAPDAEDVGEGIEAILANRQDAKNAKVGREEEEGPHAKTSFDKLRTGQSRGEEDKITTEAQSAQRREGVGSTDFTDSEGREGREGRREPPFDSAQGRQISQREERDHGEDQEFRPQISQISQMGREEERREPLFDGTRGRQGHGESASAKATGSPPKATARRQADGRTPGGSEDPPLHGEMDFRDDGASGFAALRPDRSPQLPTSLRATPDKTPSQAREILERIAGRRIGLVGRHPEGFDTCEFEEEELRELLGLGVERVPLEEVFRTADGQAESAIGEVREKVGADLAGTEEVDQDALDRSLRVFGALRELAEQRGASALAVRCWPEFFTEYGCAACGPMGMLTEAGIPCACEADMYGAATSLLLQAISGEPPFMADLVHLDMDDGTGVLWHCGLAPLSMADPDAAPRAGIHSNRKLPLLAEFALKPGRVTLARFSQSRNRTRLVIGGGEMLKAPPSFGGTSGVIRFDTPAATVLDRLMGEGLEHHVNLAYGDHREVLRAVAEVLGVGVVEL